MITYPKIDTLLERDLATFKVIQDRWKKPSFEYLKNNDWYFTEKIHGTNTRVLWDGNVSTLRYGGRSEDTQIPVFLLKKIQDIFEPLRDKLTSMFDSPVTFYGEGFGAKIQKGGGNYIKDDVDFALFDVLVQSPDGLTNWWLERKNVEDIASKLGLTIVPIVGTGTLTTAIALAKAGIRSHWGDFEAEGIVVKPVVELCERNGERVIGKIKTKDFPKES